MRTDALALPMAGIAIAALAAGATAAGPRGRSAPSPAPATVSATAPRSVTTGPVLADRTTGRRPVGFAFGDPSSHSPARRWNEVLLEGIRNDLARPTIHARNLYHLSAAMWDAWAAFDPTADGVFSNEKMTADDVDEARRSAISHAMNRMLRHRFSASPGADVVGTLCDGLMIEFGYDPEFDELVGDAPAPLGNRIAQAVIDAGLLDHSNEQDGYANLVYEPVNDPLLPDFPGNPDISDPNRWQPLALEFFIDQAGNPHPLGYPDFLSPEWGAVTPFSLKPEDATVRERDGYDWITYHDPGGPPLIGGDGDEYYKWGFTMVSVWSGHLDPADGVMIDVSPASIGNAPLTMPDQYESFYDFLEGGDSGQGYPANPVTGLPYEPQIVPRGDYGRILAEFWADGPHSETPPGHWYVILNYVSDHPLLEKRIGGEGPIVDAFEWDVKSYLALGGAMHDVAVAVWGVKGWYDYIRPVSAIRYMADRGQSSDPDGPSYHPDGIMLVPGRVEVVTEETIQPGERHAHLAGDMNENLGKIAVHAWRGPEYIVDPDTDVAGTGWILAENWWPYQRPSFVSPPFAGFVSGHSTFSRTAARVMEFLTGSEYFPGGLGEFVCPQNEYLVFEDGPSVDVTLQWARYMDASDQCSLSRIWGGIHPPADDLPGRVMGEAIAPEAWHQARLHYAGLASCPGDVDGDGATGFADLLAVLTAWGPCDGPDCVGDRDLDGTVGPADIATVFADWGACP